jgi:conjugal transfer mating pair stabilization protein TraG
MAMTLGLSWSIVTSSLQGMATSLDGLSRSQSGIASKLGSELVDGNVSVDNQSLHNKTVASTQLAQQQLGSSFSFSDRLDDGRYTSIRGTDGSTIFKEDTSSLKTNIMESEDVSASLREDGARSLAASKEYGKLAGEQAVEASNALFDYSKSITSSKDSSHGFGHTKSSGETESYQKMLDTAHKFAQSQGISDQEAFNALAIAGGAMSATASNNKHVEAAKSSGLSEQFSKNMQKSIDTMNDRKGSFSDSAQENAAKNFQGSYGKMKHYEEQQGARLAESEMYTKTASFAENRSLGLSTNITDDVLTSFADAKFDGNKEAAVRYASSHADEFKEFSKSYHSPRYEAFKEKLKSQNPMSAQDVQKVYDSVYSPSVNNTTSQTSMDQAESYAHKRGLNPQKEQQISSDIQGLKEQSERHEHKTGKTFDSKHSALQGTMNADEKEFTSQKDSSLVYRSGKTALKGVVREVSPVVSFIGKHALQPEERNEGMGTSSYHQLPRPQKAPPVQPPVKSTS